MSMYAVLCVWCMWCHWTGSYSLL